MSELKEEVLGLKAVPQAITQVRDEIKIIETKIEHMKKEVNINHDTFRPDQLRFHDWYDPYLRRFSLILFQFLTMCDGKASVARLRREVEALQKRHDSDKVSLGHAKYAFTF